MESLKALALLEATAASSSAPPDRLGLFMPFIIDSLSRMRGTVFTTVDLQCRITKEFSLEIPQPVVQSLLDRCCAENKVSRMKGGKYKLTEQELPLFDLASKQDAVEEEQRQLVLSLLSYAEGDGIGFFNDEEISKQLASYLDENFGLVSIGDTERISSLTSEGRHSWIGRFLLDAQKRRAPEFDVAVRLARGRIYYNAAYLPESNVSERCFESTTVYLDSPVVCAALGYSSPVAESHTKEVIAVLQASGARCCVLDITANEISRVLMAIYESWGRPREDEPPDSYAYWFLNRGVDRGQIWRWAQDPSMEIEEKLMLEVLETPPRAAESVLSEESLAKRLLRPDGYEGDPRVWHDVDCVAAVLRKRGKSVPRRVHTASCYFAGNSPLTIANVRKWWNEDEHRTDMPPMVAASDLATFAWLNSAASAVDKYSESALLASCAAATIPSERVWADCRRKLDQFVSRGELREDAARAFLFSSDLRIVLAESEQRGSFPVRDDGDVDVDIGRVIDETIDHMALGRLGGRLDAAEKEKARINELMAKADADAKASKNEASELKVIIEERNKELSSLHEDASRQREEAARAQHQFEAVQGSLDAQAAHLRRIAEKKARRFSALVIATGILLAIIGVILFAIYNPDGSLNVASLLSALSGIAMLVFGISTHFAAPLRKEIEARELSRLFVDGVSAKDE